MHTIQLSIHPYCVCMRVTHKYTRKYIHSNAGLQSALRDTHNMHTHMYMHTHMHLVSYPDPRHSSGWITSPLRGSRVWRISNREVRTHPLTAAQSYSPLLAQVVVLVRMTNPFVPPRPYAGDCSWKDWVGHFEAVAKVNGWDNATKLNWLPVQLTGEALTAWNDLTEEARGDCKSAMEELQERLQKTSKGKGKCFCCYSSIRRLFTEACYTMFKACIVFIMTALGFSVLAYCLHWNFNMTSQVRKTFENPMPPSLIREGFHIPRKEEDEIRDAFLKKN